eukprot:jgi/Bigna1/89476/estExt_fgenesh1_pg.C_500016
MVAAMVLSSLLWMALGGSAANDFGANIGFGNDCSEEIVVNWVNFEGEEVRVTSVEPQMQSWLGTFINHKFVFRTNNGQFIGDVTVEHKSQFTAPTCDHPCHTQYGGKACLESLEGYRNHDNLKATWNKQNEERKLANLHQPQHLKNFTEFGFEKRPIPPEVWEIVNGYYQANKDSIVLEKWPASNPYINHWEAVPMMIWLPELHSGDQTKQMIFDGLRPHLEEWSGVELEQTDMYGMRVYKNNTFLENHVDRIGTHVVSVIMHVADSGDHEWPLNIFDHNGKEHNVTIKAGEMVLYESATCVHGRPSKYLGDYYVNAFAHFRPKGKWVQFLRKNNNTP